MNLPRIEWVLLLDSLLYHEGPSEPRGLSPHSCFLRLSLGDRDESGCTPAETIWRNNESRGKLTQTQKPRLLLSDRLTQVSKKPGELGVHRPGPLLRVIENNQNYRSC